RFSVKACSDAPSAADGTSTVTALEIWGPAAQGMPRRDKQLRSSCHQSCCWQAAAGRSEISVLATRNSSRASGNNASTPTSLGRATREAHATKRKFEYKAHLLRSEFWPPIRRKNNAAVAGLCPRKGTGPAEIETVLNGRPGRKRRFLQRTWIAGGITARAPPHQGPP